MTTTKTIDLMDRNVLIEEEDHYNLVYTIEKVGVYDLNVYIDYRPVGCVFLLSRSFR